MAPGLGDWYLGKTGFDSQMTDEPANAERPNNLWEPIDEDRGAHGSFDSRAKAGSWQLWLSTHRHWIAGAGLGALAAWLACPRNTARPRHAGRMSYDGQVSKLLSRR
jgi:hypothetical protein